MPNDLRDEKKIYLDGKMSSELDWKKAISVADSFLVNKKKGQKLLWVLDLGLFKGLTLPLEDKMQFMAFKLSIKHFMESIWSCYKNDSIGVCLYEGDFSFREGEFKGEGEATFTHSFLEKLYLRDQALYYLSLLKDYFPAEIELFLSIDMGSQNLREFSLLEEVLFFSKDKFTGYSLLQEREEETLEDKHSNFGVCLPGKPLLQWPDFCELEKALAECKKEGKKIRVIPEEQIITDWDGLDYLLCDPAGLTEEGKRMLQGFAAAGGVVVSLGEAIGVYGEEAFSTWLISQKEAVCT